MKLQACRSCGGALERKGNHYYCRFCGNRWAIDAADDVHVVDRANAWAALRDCDFERSAELFENIILKEPKSHEAYWGRCLALSGIIYVTDLNENKKVPTCNNISEDSFLDHPDYKKAIDYAPAEIAESYKKQGEQIEKIRLEWLGKARKEPPYDVFISFKDSDREKGVERTQDSIDAQDLYNALVVEGYKVFFSRISLRNKVSEQYEPYIYNAIKTAKVMIVFGESPEYFSAVWIKNEWSRFKTRIENGEKHKNSLVVAYKNMDPATLPVVLRTRQCLNAAEMTFLPDLLRHIKRVVDESKQASHIEKIEIKGGQISKRATKIANETITTREIGEGAIANTDVSEKQQLDLVKTYIKSGEWEDAENLLDTILFSNPTYAEAIWLSLAVKFRVKSDKAIIEKLSLFTNEDYSLVEKILNCATKSFATQLLDLLYLSYNVVESEIFFRIIQLILPYKYEHRESRIRELFEYSITDDKFTLFKLFISTLDSTAVDEYISYNFKYIENTKSSAAEIECLENILSVDNGNIDALKMKFNIQRIGASFELLTQNFEEILKYSKEPQNEVIEVFNLISKTVATEDYCKFAIQLLKYYDGELLELKDKLLTLASNMLKNGFFDHAEHIYKLILTFEPDNAAVYWGICLIKLGARSDRDVVKAETSIKTIPEYTKYLTLVDESRRMECMSLAKRQANRHKSKKKARIALVMLLAAVFFCFIMFFVISISISNKNRDNYQQAIDLMNQGKYTEAIEIFESLGKYQDCPNRIVDCKTAIDYNAAVALMTEGKYTEAIEAFTALNGYKDSADKIVECETAIKDIAYDEAVALMNEGKYTEAIEAFTALNGYRDSADIITDCKYNNAVALMTEGKYTEAIEAFNALNGYRDSADKIAECETAIKDNAYNAAVALMTEGKYTEAIEAFNALNGYRDSADKIAECETAIKDNAYNAAVALMTEGKYAEAIEAFNALNGYRDSVNKISECEIAIAYDEAVALMAEGKYAEAIEAFNALNGYRDSADKIVECENAIAYYETTYNEAVALMAEGRYIEAKTMLESLGDFNDSATLYDNCLHYLDLNYVPGNNEWIVSGFASNATDTTQVIIPSIYEGKPVVSISPSAFEGCTNISTVILPDTIINIPQDAFHGCSSLTSITIPEGVTSIGRSAFGGCSSLASIKIPDSVTSISSFTFYNCSSLISITIPDSITNIGEYAFGDCTKLTIVYYTGSYSDWSKISISSSGNSYLQNAQKIYNYVPEE